MKFIDREKHMIRNLLIVIALLLIVGQLLKAAPDLSAVKSVTVENKSKEVTTLVKTLDQEGQ